MKSVLSNEITGILPSCSCVSTTVWVCHFNKTLGVKAKWELYKDTACCFEQILEAAPHKTATVQPITYHLTNHQSDEQDLLDQQEQTQKHTSVCWSAKTYIHQLCVDTGCNVKDLPRATTSWDRWWESRKSVLSAQLDYNPENSNCLYTHVSYISFKIAMGFPLIQMLHFDPRQKCQSSIHPVLLVDILKLYLKQQKLGQFG